MSDDQTPISLATLAEGALGARFDHALTEALENALDINRDHGKARSVTLVVTVKPKSEERREASFEGLVKNNLAPLAAINSSVYFGRHADTGMPVAVAVDPMQLSIFKGDGDETKVVPIERASSDETE